MLPGKQILFPQQCFHGWANRETFEETSRVTNVSATRFPSLPMQGFRIYWKLCCDLQLRPAPAIHQHAVIALILHVTLTWAVTVRSCQNLNDLIPQRALVPRAVAIARVTMTWTVIGYALTTSDAVTSSLNVATGSGHAIVAITTKARAAAGN